ncbi:MAG: type I-E CRISPR-associated protein Cse2/CasB, partial [Terracidiphilus sp.]
MRTKPTTATSEPPAGSLRDEHESFDARFRRLLSCDREEIYDRLRPVILAARPRGIPVN